MGPKFLALGPLGPSSGPPTWAQLGPTTHLGPPWAYYPLGPGLGLLPTWAPRVGRGAPRVGPTFFISLPAPKLGASRMGATKMAPAAMNPQVGGFQKYKDLFLIKKSACGNVPTSWRLPKIWGHSSEKKNKTKTPAATYRQVRGFQKYGDYFPTP